MSAVAKVKDEQKSGLITHQEKPATENQNRMSTNKEQKLKTLGEKEKHQFNTGCSLFPIHMWLYFLYIALAIILPIFGTLLIICGNYGNTGYFSLFAILNYPFPGLKVEDPNYTASSLEVLQVRLGGRVHPQLTCWVSGFFFWLFSIYLVYAITVYHRLMWAALPWQRAAWGGVRTAADRVLQDAKVQVLLCSSLRSGASPRRSSS